MFLESITINNNFELESNRDDQAKRFKIKSKEYLVDDRRKPIIGGDKQSWGRVKYEKRTVIDKSFILFKKGLKVNFENNITVIVGDNGCGKTSLVKFLKPPNMDMLPFYMLHDKTEEEVIKEEFDRYINNDRVTLKFSKAPSYIILEKDIHKNSFTKELKESKGTLSGEEVYTLFNMYASSNGENTLDFLMSLDRVENGLIVLDEPETSLSLKSQQLIKNHLLKLSEKNQIIVITHSPILMGLVDEVYDFEKHKNVNTEKYIKSQIP